MFLRHKFVFNLAKGRNKFGSFFFGCALSRFAPICTCKVSIFWSTLKYLNPKLQYFSFQNALLN